MSKRPDYGDATPEDLVIALMRFQRAPLKKTRESDETTQENDKGDQEPTTQGDSS